MPLSDLALADLREFRPQVEEPADFDDFWARTLDESRAAGRAPVCEAVDAGLPLLEVYDLTFSGFGGEPVRAWVSLPRHREGRLPAVLEYVGYGGSRGSAGESIRWAAAGYAHVIMDTRGQGGSWGSGGSTPDPHGSDPASAGFMTRGILRPESYYYRRLFTDAVRLVDAVRTLDAVDPHRIAVTGMSQGGGVTLAVAGLVPDLLAVMPDVPFLSCFRRSTELTPDAPFTEITRYLSIYHDRTSEVFRTLSYHDAVNFARRAASPALFSVGLMDTIVLPSTVFAAFNHYRGEDRRIEVYEFNGHEGGGHRHWRRQLEWLRALDAARLS